jgi:hypothetical protein
MAHGRLGFFASSAGKTGLLRGFSMRERILYCNQYGRRPVLAQLKKAMENAANITPVSSSRGMPHSCKSKRNGKVYPITAAKRTNFQSELTTPNLTTGR